MKTETFQQMGKIERFDHHGKAIVIWYNQEGAHQDKLLPEQIPLDPSLIKSGQRFFAEVVRNAETQNLVRIVSAEPTEDHRLDESQLNRYWQQLVAFTPEELAEDVSEKLPPRVRRGH